MDLFDTKGLRRCRIDNRRAWPEEVKERQVPQVGSIARLCLHDSRAKERAKICQQLNQEKNMEMEWRLLATTFATIFAAELGDKTQIATLSFASTGLSRWVVFAGASLALVSTTALAVVIGEGLGRVVPPLLLRRVAGGLFIVLGVLYLISRPETGP